MKKILFVFLLTGIISATQVKAQENIWSIQYSMGFAMGDLKDYNSSASFRGVSFEYRNLIQPAIGIGFETGYNLFYDREDYSSYTRGTETISGVQFRYSHMVPVLAAFDYYLKPDTYFNPFVGLGIGTLYVNRQVDMGMYRWTEDAWQFALRPEIGVMYSKPGMGTEFILAAKYFSGLAAKELDGQQYFTINLGIVF